MVVHTCELFQRECKCDNYIKRSVEEIILSKGV